MQPMHQIDSSMLLVAGLGFIVGYVLGLEGAAKYGKALVWPAVIVGILACLVRGFSPPLGVFAIAASSVLHFSIGVGTVLIMKYCKPKAKSTV